LAGFLEQVRTIAAQPRPIKGRAIRRGKARTMTDHLRRKIFLCSCEGTMAPDGAAAAKACGGDVVTADQLCRGESDRLRAALATGAEVTVACTQEQPLFEELAEEAGHAAPRAYANIRETAGWTAEAAASGPKMAALLAAAAAPAPPVGLVAMTSQGAALILGRDETALEAGRRLAEHLAVTVLLEPGAEVPPPRRTEFPILQGRVRAAVGHLGAFELSVEAPAQPSPSSRAVLAFAPAGGEAALAADVVLDLRGGPPLFPGDDLRPGYVRADPAHPSAVEAALMRASHLVGAFDKPRFVGFDAGLCAHSRNKIIGCTRCLDVCPAGAITPAGDTVAIDPMICAGCGQCASACPTGAAHYALPPVETLLGRLRALLRAYAAAGGRDAVVLLHDEAHGAALVEASGRFGRGLPARVLPFAVNETTQAGPEVFAAALAYGATAVAALTARRPRHDIAALRDALALAGASAAALGYGEGAVALIQADDPAMLEEALAALPSADAARPASAFLPAGEKRGLLTQAFRELHRVAPAPVARVALPQGAPFGAAIVDTEGCTLCLACTAVCPTGALSDSPDRPTLRFTESLCVQCGLCAATCPEKVIALEPRLDFEAWDRPRAVVKEEEPFHCVRCAKPFGTRSTIERIREKLSAHWMYSGPEGEARRQVLEMCDDCRVAVVVEETFDPHEVRTRAIRTTEDYLRERAAAKAGPPE
jgi:ferredoxin